MCHNLLLVCIAVYFVSDNKLQCVCDNPLTICTLFSWKSGRHLEFLPIHELETTCAASYSALTYTWLEIHSGELSRSYIGVNIFMVKLLVHWIISINRLKCVFPFQILNQLFMHFLSFSFALIAASKEIIPE